MSNITRIEPGPRMSAAVVHNGIAYLAGQVGAPGGSVTEQTQAAPAEPLTETKTTDLEALARPQTGRPAPFLLCCDGVTDPGNLGALLRSAECAGVTGVVLPRHRAVHVTPTVAKAAAGAIEYLPMSLVGGLPTALRRLSELGVWVVGLDGAADRSLWDVDIVDGPVALVLGAEGPGLSRLARQRCDQVVAIAMRGRLSSLNVGTAGALAVFEIARRRAP